MIAYFDTSAIVPILIAERSTDFCRQLWIDADARVSSRITLVEASAALAAGERQGRLSPAGLEKAMRSLDEIWHEIDVVEVTAELCTSAAALARNHALRGHDAVHCASAASVDDGNVIAAAGDRGLLAAWRQLDMTVADLNGAT